MKKDFICISAYKQIDTNKLFFRCHLLSQAWTPEEEKKKGIKFVASKGYSLPKK